MIVDGVARELLFEKPKHAVAHQHLVVSEAKGLVRHWSSLFGLGRGLAALAAEYQRAVRGHDATFTVHQTNLVVAYLTLAAFPAQLANSFNDSKQSSSRPGVRVRQHSTVGVDGKSPEDVRLTLCKQNSTLASLAQAEFFGLDNRYNAETVIKLGELNIPRSNSGHRVGQLAGTDCAELRQARCRNQVFVGVVLTDAEKPSRLAGAILGEI